jgi:hypothetical protein
LRHIAFALSADLRALRRGPDVAERVGVTASRTFLSVALGLLGLVAGCVVSPQPSPPDFTLTGDLIGLTPVEAATDTLVGFSAAPGTVHPAQGVVVVTNLDAHDAPSFAQVKPDGSFAIALSGGSGQSFRFQAKSGDVRSQPFDLVVAPSGDGITALTAGPACLAVTPALWLSLDGAGDARSLVIENKCAGAVALAAPHLRRGLAGFSFSPTAPLTLLAGGSSTLTVHGGAGAEVEDVLDLDVTGPTLDHRAVTLTIPDR